MFPVMACVPLAYVSPWHRRLEDVGHKVHGIALFRILTKNCVASLYLTNYYFLRVDHYPAVQVCDLNFQL